MFTTCSQEAKWKPKITVDSAEIRVESSPRFLGVLLDRQLQFGPHADHVITKMAAKQNIISAVANTKWGWRKEYLTQLYSAFIHSLSTYAGFAWLPCTAKSNKRKIERAQNKALRLVTGQYKATPTEALRLECGLISFDTEAFRMIAKSAEKAERLPMDHPRNIAYTGTTRKRLKQENWRDTAKSLIDLLPRPLRDRVQIRNFTTDPWLEASCLEVYPELEGVVSRLESEQIKRDAALRRIREVDAPVVIYTDGSAHRGTIRGGAAAIVTKGDPEHPEELHSMLMRGADFTCSYEEEVEAMKMATQYIRDNNKGDELFLICTDSQSLCMALRSFNPETDVIRETLKDFNGSVIIQWIPGHSMIPGNELADFAAKEASNQIAPGRPITLRSANMQIREAFKDNIKHDRTRKIYSAFNMDTEKELQTRKEQVTIAQLRSGKHRALMSYMNQIDGDVSSKCPRCNEEDHTVEHWFLKCPGTLQARQDIFGGDEDYGLHYLTKHPARSLALARRTLLGAGR